MGAVALGSPGLRGLRFLNAALATVLVVAAFLVEDTSWLARIHNVLMGGLFFVLSVVPGRSWGEALAEDGAARL